MEKIYSEEQTAKLYKARPETVTFLTNFSKSLNVVDYKGVKFDTFLN